MNTGEPERKLKVGFVGCGSHARMAIYPCLRMAPIELCAVCDMIPEKGQEVGGWFGAQRIYTDHIEMMEQETLDAIFVVAGPKVHPVVACDALDRGLHVWMEKPPALSSADAIEVVKRSEKAGKHVMVGFMKRFATGYVMAKEAMGDPAFGTPTMLHCRYTSAPYADEENHVRDFAIHHLDLARFFMGDVSRIYVEKSRIRDGVLAIAATVKFVNGAVGVLHLGSCEGWFSGGERVTIGGDETAVIVDNVVSFQRFPKPAPGREGDAHLKHGTFWEPNWYYPADRNSGLVHQGYAGEVRHFAESILAGAAPKPDMRDGYEALRLVEAIIESDGAVVELS